MVYHRPMKIILVAAWSIWAYRNNVIFNNSDAKPTHIINLAVKILNRLDTIILHVEFLARTMFYVNIRSCEEKSNKIGLVFAIGGLDKMNVDIS